MDRHILFYLVGRLILVNGLSLIIPLIAGLFWGERGLLYFGPSLIAAVALAVFCLYRGRHHKRQQPLRRRGRPFLPTAVPTFRRRSSYGTVSWAGWGA